MVKRCLAVMLLILILSASAVPALAAPANSDGGGFHFGPYTLAAGETDYGDLVVFGPVTLESQSRFEGTLAVFGELTMEEDAALDGDVAVMGAAEVGGVIDGNLVVGGAAHLRSSAHITGDVSAVDLTRDEGAMVDGEVIPMEEVRGYRWNLPWIGPVTVAPRPQTPLAVQVFLRVGRSVLVVLVAALFALLVASVWPLQLQRISRAVEEAPAASFGMGLLAFLATSIVVLVLAVTICLSPLAFIGLLIFGVGLALGIVALGAVLGQRVLGLFNKQPANPVGAAVLGSLLVVAVLALASLVSGWIYAPLLFLVVMPAAGAVMLTRFGTMPYATRGAVPPAAAPAIRPAPLPARPPVVPAPPVMPKPAEPPVEPESPVEVPPEPVPPVE